MNVDASKFFPEVHVVPVESVLSATAPEFVLRNPITETTEVPVVKQKKKPIKEKWVITK